jgi:hypothetical protein
VNKNTLYWVCQLGGWFVFVLLEAIKISSVIGFTPQLMVNVLVNFCGGVLLTHFYRLILIRIGWLGLPLYRLIPRAMLSIFILTVLMTAFNIPLDRYTFPDIQNIPLDFTVLFQYFFFWGKYILLWMLIYHMFQYWERSLIAEKERYQLEASLKENQYNNLKTQLNPHFLFNSLNSIRTLVDLNPDTAKEAITQLSGLLRSSLHMGRHKTVPLKDELQTVDDYLAIEKIRFDERLQIEKRVDADTLDLHVPPMLLQTLVENAIKHGISNLKSGGVIRINSYRNHLNHHVEIINTGRYVLNSDHTGVGIENSEQRLKLLYNDKASLSIGNTSPDTVTAKISIPL